MIMLNRHVPSHLTVAGHRVILFYEGQPATGYIYGEVGHMYQGRPARQRSGMVRPNPTNATYVSIVSAITAPSDNPVADIMFEMGHITTQGSAVNTTPILTAKTRTLVSWKQIPSALRE
jgi:hypothetical protein